MLQVHHADRADQLIAALAEVLEVRLADPFATEVVGIPTHGAERWLSQQLSTRLGTTPLGADGVCANVAFPSPRRLVDEAIAAAAGFDAETDPWQPARALWPLLELIDGAAGEPWLARVTAHLDRDGGDRSRRLGTARHIARLFARYATYRPAMLRAWAQGRDEDGAGATLEPDHRWQAELWRRLRTQLATPDPVELLALAARRLVEDPSCTPLPERLSLFGLTSLPGRHLELLRALSVHRDVHLLLLTPSPVAWQQVATNGDGRVVTRAQALTRTLLPTNPLLASWGRDGRELQLLLEPLPARAVHARHEGDAKRPEPERANADRPGGVTGDDPGACGRIGEDHDRTRPPRRPGSAKTLLARLQQDVRADHAPGAEHTTQALDPTDASVQIHVCHGRARQVEVLRDAILHALAEDPTLEPRDVIVMCPDIETFAPLVEATFGAGEAEVDELLDASTKQQGTSGVHPRDLRVRLADRSLRQTNPVLGVVTRLLELASARVTVSEVLDLADREPVRRRFRFEEDELARIEDWVAASGTRWGLDAEHREPYRMQHVEQGTWRVGIDRLLAGVTTAERPGATVAGVLPLDDVDSAAIDLAGRFAELLDRIAAALDALATPKTIVAWASAIADATDALTATTARDAWQRAELQALLADVLDEATTDGVTSTTELDVADVAALLGDRLAGRPTRTGFRTGHLTVCTLQPMRSVPHRVICLLGLDDAVFPRRAPRDGDDALLDEPWIGDRDGRSEDRQILLDALMAAGDRLIVTYTGRSERTNAERSPAVPVSELLDVIDRTAQAPDGGPGREAVLVEHPLQPFAAENFTPGALAGARAWSFDRVTLHGARALAGERAPRAPFLGRPLQPRDDAVIELDQLLAFVGHPIRAFLRQRLGVGAERGASDLRDELPIELGPLTRWRVGDRLLVARRAGVDAAAAIAAERSRGTLPPGEIGAHVLQAVQSEVESILAAAADAIGGGPLRAVDVRIPLPDGRTLAGTIPGVGRYVLPTVTYSRVDARRRMEAWVRLLALSAAFPDRPLVATTVGRVHKHADWRMSATVARLALRESDAEPRRARALAELSVLVDLYDRGMREPLPLFRDSSAAYAIGGAARARGEWETDFRPPREDREPEHLLVFGEPLPFEQLLAESPRPDEQGDGWDAAEPSRFGRYAKRLWSGLLAHEELQDR